MIFIFISKRVNNLVVNMKNMVIYIIVVSEYIVTVF